MSSIAYIGLGSNLGDRRSAIETAVQRLRARSGIESVTISSVYETAAVGGPAGQRPYLNAAARAETTLSPRELLDALMAIERELGRRRRQRWGPRTIDLDLLLFDDRVIQTPELTIPHPRMHERAFVLEPLAEIAPQALHPLLGATMRQLKQSLAARGGP
ncbi:MAG: 2-amino-4-hydroxy-6-hydroxymethyldihydropteridine diphosphokinase [Phycisphaerae bacterium]|jgi:2-amino-4-hydroxy-6-hydroxymethyldihydropteridine diphosphokinase